MRGYIEFEIKGDFATGVYFLFKLGKKKGKIYKYTGKFTKEYLRDRLVVIIKFCVDYDDKPSTCEAFIKLKGGSGGQCEWIPRNEIINYLT